MEGVTTVVDSLFGTLSTVVSTVTANNILLIGIAGTVGGIAISWFKRLTGQRSGRRR